MVCTVNPEYFLTTSWITTKSYFLDTKNTRGSNYCKKLLTYLGYQGWGKDTELVKSSIGEAWVHTASLFLQASQLNLQASWLNLNSQIFLPAPLSMGHQLTGPWSAPLPSPPTCLPVLLPPAAPRATHPQAGPPRMEPQLLRKLSFACRDLNRHPGMQAYYKPQPPHALV